MLACRGVQPAGADRGAIAGRLLVLTDKSLHFGTDVRCTSGTALLDPRLLRLVLDNLIDNAIRFTGTGGHVRVEVRDGEDDALVFEVADDGCGIGAEDQARVFERFYQVEQARSDTETPSGGTRGTGLGLAIVRHAVAAMGGTVTLDSTPGQGTRVRVILLRAPSHAPQ